MTYREKIKAELLRLRESSLEYGQTKEQRIFVDTGKDLVLSYLERFIDCLHEEQKPHNPKVREVTGKLRELLDNMDEDDVARNVSIKLMKSLWKDADGEELPNIDKEVIVLSDPIGDGFYRVSFGHRVDPDRVVRTSIDGKPMILHPQKYDKGGWNIQGVKYWLNLELPNKVKE